MRRHLLGHRFRREPGGLPVDRPPAGPETYCEGQPRLLVEHRRQDAALFPGERHHLHRHPPQQLLLLRGVRPVRHQGLVLRGGADRSQREGPQPGGGPAGGVPAGGGGPAEAGVPPLPPPVHRLPLPGDHQKAGGISGGALLLRPSPRPHP